MYKHVHVGAKRTLRDIILGVKAVCVLASAHAVRKYCQKMKQTATIRGGIVLLKQPVCFFYWTLLELPGAA